MYTRQKRDKIENSTTAEPNLVNHGINTFGHEPTEIIDQASESQSKKGESVELHSTGENSQDSAAVTAERGARESEAKTDTATRNFEGGGHGSEMETDIKSDTDSQSTESESETDSETESEQAIQENAEEIVKNANYLRMYNMPENLRQMDRNTSFLKVVCDRRRGEAPKIRCMTDDLYANFDIKTEMIDFELTLTSQGHFGSKIVQV